jgi:UDP-N-acetylglucosamine 2-epimerase (non-hydrolysing)
VACTLVSAKVGLPVAHVEAGLRSFDRQMPEEINRIVVDGLATWLLTPSEDAAVNLLHEGVHPDRIRFVGNVMVDSLHMALRKIDVAATHDRLGIDGPFGLATLHRPSLVDDPKQLAGVMSALGDVSEGLPIVFPVHPRTRQNMARFGIEASPTIRLLDPLSYLDFVALESTARLVLTDSGGVQEETTCLGVPCLTLRTSTERPITVSHGTNRVIGTNPTDIAPAVHDALSMAPTERRPARWDGRAAHRIIDELGRPVSPVAWMPYDQWRDDSAFGRADLLDGALR